MQVIWFLKLNSLVACQKFALINLQGGKGTENQFITKIYVVFDG